MPTGDNVTQTYYVKWMDLLSNNKVCERERVITYTNVLKSKSNEIWWQGDASFSLKCSGDRSDEIVPAKAFSRAVTSFYLQMNKNASASDDNKRKKRQSKPVHWTNGKSLLHWFWTVYTIFLSNAIYNFVRMHYSLSPQIDDAADDAWLVRWVVFLSSGSKCKVNNRLPGAGITLFAKIFHVHCFPRHRAIGSIKIGSFKTGSIGLSQKFIRGNLKSEFSKSTKFGKWPYCLFKSLNHPHRCSKRKIVKMQFE